MEEITYLELLIVVLVPLVTIIYYFNLITDFPYVETKKEYIKYLLIPFYGWYVMFIENYNELD